MFWLIPQCIHHTFEPIYNVALFCYSLSVFWEHEYDDEYIGESTRNFEERYKQHLKAPSPFLNTKNYWPHNISGKHQNHTKGGSKYGQGHQGRHIHQSEQTYPQQKHWQIQPATHIWNKALFTTLELKTK